MTQHSLVIGSRRLNAVCPTSLDSHNFYCIVRSVYKSTFDCPFKTPLPCPTWIPRVLVFREVTNSYHFPRPSLGFYTHTHTHPSLLPFYFHASAIATMRNQFVALRTQRNHEITQHKITRSLLCNIYLLRK